MLEIREIGKDLGLGHAGGEVRQDVVDRDTQATDARLPAPLTRFDRVRALAVINVD